MDQFFIFCAKYLYLLAIAAAGVCFVRLPRDRKKELVILSVITLPAIYIAARLAGLLYFDPRPFVVGRFVPLIPHAADNGFPSDHMLLTSAIAVVLYPASRKASLTVSAIAILVGISRVYAGVHHPVDIIGSAAIAVAVGYACFAAYGRFGRGRGENTRSQNAA